MFSVKTKVELAQVKYLNELLSTKRNVVNPVFRFACVTEFEGSRYLFATDAYQARWMCVDHYSLECGLYKFQIEKDSAFFIKVEDLDLKYPDISFLLDWENPIKDYKLVGEVKASEKDIAISKIIFHFARAYPEIEKIYIKQDLVDEIMIKKEKDFSLVHGDDKLQVFFNGGKSNPIVFRGANMTSVVMPVF